MALRALAWLVAHDELRPVFLGSTGLAQEDLLHRADDPEMLAAILDFLLMDDAWVIAFCQAEGLPGEALLQARADLPGGNDPHWT
ncbi:hypothetical protein RGUI_1477 [Rhodovulum sp. P5]|nr:hypothetical protein RGUI_1477 [Rhodovulum sp. P5]